MSSENFQIGLTQYFKNDSVLAGLLGKGSDGKPSVHPMHFRDVADPMYPLITIARFGSGLHDNMFGEYDVFCTAMDNPKIAICIWDKQAAINCWEIFNRVDFLLRGNPPVNPIPAAGPHPSANPFLNYKVLRGIVRDDLWDDQINAYHFHAEYQWWVYNPPSGSL